jgi:hypothetical protein
MIDEVRLSELGYVVHEVEFSRDSGWLIESEHPPCRWRSFEEQQRVP